MDITRNLLANIFGGRPWIWLLNRSLAAAVRERGWDELVARLRIIVPDVLPPSVPNRGHWELKRRLQHAFQCTLLLKALDTLPQRNVRVVDIGGTGIHTRYLSVLGSRGRSIDTVDVNVDPDVIAAQEAWGRQALLCRAEKLAAKLAGEQVDLFLMFETAEHLHDPALFFHRLARRFDCPVVLTVPYVRRSRVGLFNVRQGNRKVIAAGDEHIFELTPDDWTLLLRHAGWKVTCSDICRQYPTKYPLLRWYFSSLWRHAEFEGSWGAILTKDLTSADRYADWEEDP
jgi:hypothetical protein